MDKKHEKSRGFVRKMYTFFGQGPQKQPNFSKNLKNHSVQVWTEVGSPTRSVISRGTRLKSTRPAVFDQSQEISTRLKKRTSPVFRAARKSRGHMTSASIGLGTPMGAGAGASTKKNPGGQPG